ncbi:hypothetical protein ES703_44494 [subsurface metagenome]
MPAHGIHVKTAEDHPLDVIPTMDDAHIPPEIARDAEVDSKISDHAGIPDAHHAKYTDAEAQATVKANVEVGDLKAPTKALDMNSQKITGLPTPTAGSDAVTKDHVDSVVQGLDWQPSVLDELDTPPGTPDTGDRYLVIATATGDWAGHEDDIAEWDGSAWVFTTPNKGFAVWIEDVGRQKNYNGTDWVTFGSTVDHGSLTGVGPSDHHAKYTDAEAAAVAAVEVAAHEELESPHAAATAIGGKTLGLADGGIAVLPAATEGQVLKRGASGWEAGGVPAEVTVYKAETEPAIAADSVAIWCDTTAGLEKWWMIFGIDGTVEGNKKVEMG